ncbi:recombinase family protein [Bradyrhizobium sp. 190]|uniref:recombinase family protein n=1 Tax=Bradyrhizobium sp. 190 TaxID=2782658 RepID=UPI001FF9FE15|nr:recombinase family protein [Bradyrhizobium sp. 190]MCK1518627.1 recombinase family protein [Bradyrhizobium sp. 190]
MNQPVLAVTKAYSYVRFSTPQQALGDSLRRQTEKAERYAIEHGLTLDTDLKMTDAGVSAFRGKNATTGALGGFLSAVESGYVSPGSYLLIENIDRLSRDHVLEAQTLFARLILAGIIIVTLTNGEAYSRQRLNEEPHAMLMIVLEQIRANQENVRKSQLIGDAKARKKQQLAANGLNGKPYTRQTPAWITWSDESKAYELLPERAAIVREIYERTDAGDGIDRIAKDLNQRGVETWGGRRGQRKANHWRGSYMRKILMSSAPIGSFTPRYVEHDEVTRARRDIPMDPIVNMFPAVVEEELYWRVNRRFATTAPRGKNARHDPKSIVAGIVRCATCGNAVTRVSKGAYVYLVCSRANMRAKGCKYLAVPYSAVETALRENVGWLIEEAPRGKNTAALDREIAGLVTMVGHYSDEASDLADLAAQEKTPVARKRLREKSRELGEAQALLRTITAQRDTLTTASVRDRLRAVKKALGPDTVNVVGANQALRQAVARIILDPENARLEVYWHHSPGDVQVINFHTRHKRWVEGSHELSDHAPSDAKAS